MYGIYVYNYKYIYIYVDICTFTSTEDFFGCLLFNIVDISLRLSHLTFGINIDVGFTSKVTSWRKTRNYAGTYCMAKKNIRNGKVDAIITGRCNYYISYGWIWGYDVVGGVILHVQAHLVGLFNSPLPLWDAASHISRCATASARGWDCYSSPAASMIETVTSNICGLAVFLNLHWVIPGVVKDWGCAKCFIWKDSLE